MSSNLWLDPTGHGPAAMYLWAQNLIRTLRRSSFAAEPGRILGGKLSAANFNSTADQAISISSPSQKYRVDSIVVGNMSASGASAVGGIYTAASKGGTAVIAALTAYSSLTGVTATQKADGINGAGSYLDKTSNVTLYLSLTTAHGAAVTGDVWVYITPLP